MSELKALVEQAEAAGMEVWLQGEGSSNQSIGMWKQGCSTAYYWPKGPRGPAAFMLTANRDRIFMNATLEDCITAICASTDEDDEREWKEIENDTFGLNPDSLFVRWVHERGFLRKENERLKELLSAKGLTQ